MTKPEMTKNRSTPAGQGRSLGRCGVDRRAVQRRRPVEVLEVPVDLVAIAMGVARLLGDILVVPGREDVLPHPDRGHRGERLLVRRDGLVESGGVPREREAPVQGAAQPGEVVALLGGALWYAARHGPSPSSVCSFS